MMTMSRDIKPEFPREAVNRAGNNVRLERATNEDILIIENWRASHNHILNSWQASLRKRSKGNESVIIAQPLKRRNTIFDKLSREEGMKLSRMQDIAGCRLIFRDLEQLHSYRNKLH